MSPVSVDICVKESREAIQRSLVERVVPLLAEAMLAAGDAVRFEAVIVNQVSSTNPWRDTATFSIRQSK